MGNNRPLTDSERAWAANLKTVYEQKKKAEGLTQEILAEKMGISTSAISQYINGKIILNIQAKVLFAIALQCEIKDIDPDIPYQPPLEDDERVLIENYRRANRKGKKLILEVSEVSPAYQLKPPQTD